MRLLILKLFILLYTLSVVSYSQDLSKNLFNYGHPFIKNYGSKDYNINSQSWCINQDNRGIMYFGTDSGVLEFDGARWRLIKTDNNSIVRSLTIDKNGRVYVTGSSDFGYLAPDTKGQMQFFSLLNFMDKNSESFGEVWDVAATSKGVYFKTFDKVYHWSGDKITIIDSVYSYRLYTIDDEVYARDDENGLVKIVSDSTILIPGGETFAAIGVYDMLPFGDQVLITTFEDGIFIFDGKKVFPFKTDADTYLKKNQIYNACKLNNNVFAFATLRGGVVILDKEGTLINKLDVESGLLTEVVFDVFSDNQGGLWAATNEGISRIELLSPFSIIPKRNMGKSQVSELYNFGDNIFVSNVYGLFYFDKLLKKFNAVSGISSTGSNFLSIGNSLYASTISMVSEIDQNFNAKKVFKFNNAKLFNSTIDSNIVYVIDRTGITILKYNNGSLHLLKETIFFNELASVVEDNDGSLWLQTFYEGVIHVQSSAPNIFSSTDSSQMIINHYNKESGLHGGSGKIYSISEKILFSTDAGLFRFEHESKSFVPDFILGESFANAKNKILTLEKNHLGELWILAETPNGKELGKAIEQKNGSFLWKPDPIISRLDLTTVITIFPKYDSILNKEILWISSIDGLIRYDLSQNQLKNIEQQAFIRSVMVNQYSLIYGGTAEVLSNQKYLLSSDINSLHFQFSSSGYDKPESNQFQYLLEGDKDEWSHWDSETKKEYTNLSAGDYIFHLRSKNVYGVLGSEDTFVFTILPAWYFTWWAYIIYFLLFLAVINQVRRWELKRLNKKHHTQLELVEFSKLKELDQLKSQFFANISHEFRTPLTLILGQTESVMSSNIEIKEKGKLQVANRNAKRLLSLINELLDLSKLESGSMELKANQHNIVSFLKSLFYSFESLAETKNIIMKFESEKENIPVLFEPDKMEKIFYNLISNAFKFTDEHGEIKVELKIEPPSLVQISVKDSGTGIHPDQLPHIFNRFYQADSSTTREYEGTGIGLSLTKELVELHNGTITATSGEGKGSLFTILLPLSNLINDQVEELEQTDLFEAGISELEKNAITVESEKVNTKSADNKEIILIVEDNIDVRAYIKEHLCDEYSVIEASNGEEGILEAETNIPDLIITDVMMPKMDGYQLSKNMSKNEKTSHIPIIMLTAKASLDDKIEGLETGVDAYLTKPFNAKELQVRVKNLISQRKQLRKQFSKSTIIKPSEVSVLSVDQEFLEKTVSIIEFSFDDENFSVDNLAEKVNMSLSQLNRKLNALIDQPAGQLIRSLRLQRAADLLKQNAGSVAEICYMVGFNDQGYFSRVFKKQFECSPSDYKKNNSDL